MPIDFAPIHNMQQVNLAQIYGQADQANEQKMRNQLIQQRMLKDQQEQADEQAVKGAYAFTPEGGLDEKVTLANLYKTSPKNAYDFQQALTKRDAEANKAKREDAKSQLGNAKVILDLQGQSAKSVLANPTLDNAIYTTQQFGKLTGQDVSGEIANLQQIGDNPDALRKWAGGHALSAEQMLGKIQTVNNGQFTIQQMVAPITGEVTETGRTQMLQTPDNVASNERMVQEGALNRGVTMRGQNMTDSRQREKNAIDQSNGGYSAKPIPATALKIQNETLDKLSTASNINKDLSAIEGQLASGTLSFGPVKNLVNQAKNMAGSSDTQSRNFASFKSTLEKLRNDSLRLNTGVQTDGDAQRAWNELFNNINDTGLVKQRLAEIKKINARGADLQKLQVENIRSNYNAPPIDYTPYESQKPALNNGNNAPTVGTAKGGYVFVGGDPANPKSWKKQ